jgi:spore germination protein YaaH
VVALVALLALSSCAIGRPTATATPPRHPEELWGYIPYYDLASAWSSAAANRPRLTGVAVVMYYLAADGGLLAYPDAETIPAWATEQQLAIVPVIANSQRDGWDRDIVAGIIGDPDRRSQHIGRIVAMVVAGSYPGVEIDYESLTAGDREDFSRFIEGLATALHAQGKTLSVAVHAKVAEPGDWGGPQAQDWARLGAAADRVVVLAYDYDPTQPGPISPLQWAGQVLRHAVELIPPR